MSKLYTAQELCKKYKGKFIDTYPHHHEKWCDKLHKYITVYEVRSVKSTIHENHNLPEDCLI
jgi:hypothetical protein